jgi:mono/diheme cytochrome c family protein
VVDAGPRRPRSFSLRNTPRFALLLAALTVTLAGIVLVLSVLVYLEAREPADTAAIDSDARGDGFRGARIFVDAGCADCHTLASAGALGTRGPDLDRHFATHRHSFEFLVTQISNGTNGMPAYRDRLTDQQIRDVATFVLEVAGRGR